MSDVPLNPTPKRLAQFEVVRRLGTGGMAEVFLAKKRGAEDTYKLLVVKRILPEYGASRHFRTMFADEAQLATRLNHPNIVQVYDFQDYGEEGQILSMEYVEGPDLRLLHRAARAQGRRLPPWVAAFIIAEVAKGLHYAHERTDESGAPIAIVHRDVSPQNILLTYDGNVKLADFGIASANLLREEPGVLKGKTGYMSPEQARAERVDRRTDIFALGVVLHELLTGKPLYGDLSGDALLEAVRQHRVEPPSNLATGVPPELERIVMKALGRTPDERFPTARVMGQELARALFGQEELVDGHVLEGVINELVPRTTHEAPQGPAPHQTASRSPSTGTRSETSTASGDAAGDVGKKGPGREVRHVAVVVFRAEGFERLAAATSPDQARRAREQLRSMLEEVAFRRGAKWNWQPEQEDGAASGPLPGLGPLRGRAVVGLLANPARAARDAAWLAMDGHESLRAISEDLPRGLRGAFGVARGIATGKRDRTGHLMQHELQPSGQQLAQLLETQASAGATLVAGGLYRLVRREFVWEELAPLDIPEAVEMGLPRSVRVHAIVRPLTRQEQAAEMARSSHDLVGRDAELADLQAAFHQVTRPLPGGVPRTGTTRVVYGEMGIGKSALLAAFLSEIPDDVAQIFRVECSPVNNELPLAVAADVVREVTGTRFNQSLQVVEGALRSELELAEVDGAASIGRRLAELVTGRLGDARDDLELELNHQQMLRGLRWYLARAAAVRPVLLIVDGLQWCDPPSLELLSELAKGSALVPVFFIFLSRPDDRVAPHVSGMVRVELHGLSAENQIRLLEARIGVTEGVAEVCADLLPRAAGNPFFLLEMVDALLERGNLEVRRDELGGQQLRRAEAAKGESKELPSTLEQLIADRLNELPPPERAVIDWLAVNGAPLTERGLRVLTGSDSDEVVARLCARGLCDAKQDLIDVRHPLTRDVAYLAIDPGMRGQMHRGLAEYLMTTPLSKGLNAALVARHFARGQAFAEAGDLYLEAALAARSSYQLALAIRYFRRATMLLPPGDSRALIAHDALESLARLQGRWSDRRRHLNDLRQRASQSRLPHWIAVALHRTALLEYDEGSLSKGAVSLQQAESLASAIGDRGVLVQVQSTMAELLRDLGDMQGALAACDRALETARSGAVSQRARAEVLRTRGTLLRRVGRVTEAVDAYAEAIALARRLGARRLEAQAKNALAQAVFVQGRYSDAVLLAQDSVRINVAIGGRLQIAKSLAIIGLSLARMGDWERGLGYLERAREAHERYGDPDAHGDTLLSTAEVHMELGNGARVAELLAQLGGLPPQGEGAYDRVHEKVVRALLALQEQKPQEAVLQAFDARQSAEAQAYVALNFYAMAIEAQARVRVGEAHTGVLLASTALGAVEATQGSEYGLETRLHCWLAMSEAQAPQSDAIRERSSRFVMELHQSLGPLGRPERYLQRAPVRAILGESAALLLPAVAGSSAAAPDLSAALDVPFEIEEEGAGPGLVSDALHSVIPPADETLDDVPVVKTDEAPSATDASVGVVEETTGLLP